MTFSLAKTVTLLLALAQFSVATKIQHRESPANFPHAVNPHKKSVRTECIQQHEISPAYLRNSDVSAFSNLRREPTNILVLDLHDGMRREMATVAKRVLSETFGMNVRVLVPESSARWCDFPGLDWWMMCGSEEREAFLRRAAEVPWVSEADLIMVSLPSVLLQLLRPLGKPMVVWITVPPEYGRQNTEAYKEWLSEFRSAADDPSIAIVSASRYDQMYVRYFYGVETEVIGLSTPGVGRSDRSSSSEEEQGRASADEEGSENKNPARRDHEDQERDAPCSRRKGCFTSERASQAAARKKATAATAAVSSSAAAMKLTAATKAAKRDSGTSIGLFPKSSWKLPWAEDMFNSSLRELNVSLVDPGTLEQYHAAIYLPYMRNTNLFLEVYRSGIPIFTPSLDFLVRLDQAYCLMSNRVYWTRTPEPCDRVYPYSPNDLRYSSYPSERAPKAHEFWLGHSEHFSAAYPGVVYFDSEEDLRKELLRVDFPEIRRLMERQNRKETQRHMKAWRGVFSKLLAAISVNTAKKRRRDFGLTNSPTGVVVINGSCPRELQESSFQTARTQLNRRCKVIEIDWDAFPARHSCDTWYDLYGIFPGGP